MKIITQENRDVAAGAWPRQEVRGVELNGFEDAVNFAGRLGAYAQDTLATALPRYMFGDRTYIDLGKNSLEAFLADTTPPLAAEALTLQAQLLRQIASGAIREGAFSFMATDAKAGAVLKATAKLLEDKVEAAAVRPKSRFPDIVDPVTLKLLALGLLSEYPDHRKSSRLFELNKSDYKDDRHRRELIPSEHPYTEKYLGKRIIK